MFLTRFRMSLKPPGKDKNKKFKPDGYEMSCVSEGSEKDMSRVTVASWCTRGNF